MVAIKTDLVLMLSPEFLIATGSGTPAFTQTADLPQLPEPLLDVARRDGRQSQGIGPQPVDCGEILTYEKVDAQVDHAPASSLQDRAYHQDSARMTIVLYRPVVDGFA